MGAPDGGNNPDGTITGINVTPFVDVMLVLLILFLVSAKLMSTSTAAVPVTLPKSGATQEIARSFIVTLRKAGQLEIAGVPVSEAQFQQQMRTEHSNHPELKVVLAADGDASHRAVVHVMELLRDVQITEIAFGVQKTP